MSSGTCYQIHINLFITKLGKTPSICSFGRSERNVTMYFIASDFSTGVELTKKIFKILIYKHCQLKIHIKHINKTYYQQKSNQE